MEWDPREGCRTGKGHPPGCATLAAGDAAKAGCRAVGEGEHHHGEKWSKRVADNIESKGGWVVVFAVGVRSASSTFAECGGMLLGDQKRKKKKEQRHIDPRKLM